MASNLSTVFGVNPRTSLAAGDLVYIDQGPGTDGAMDGTNLKAVMAAQAPVQSVAGRTGTVTLGVADVSGAAPLASPTLTGTVTMPDGATWDSSGLGAATAMSNEIVFNKSVNGNFNVVHATNPNTGTSAVTQFQLGNLSHLATVFLTGTGFNNGVVFNDTFGFYNEAGPIIFEVPGSTCLIMSVDGSVKLSPGYTVSTLPSSPLVGSRAYVTDATSPTWLGALTGGGLVKCPVFYNGSAWVAG